MMLNLPQVKNIFKAKDCDDAPKGSRNTGHFVCNGDTIDEIIELRSVKKWSYYRIAAKVGVSFTCVRDTFMRNYNV